MLTRQIDIEKNLECKKLSAQLWSDFCRGYEVLKDKDVSFFNKWYSDFEKVNKEKIELRNRLYKELWCDDLQPIEQTIEQPQLQTEIKKVVIQKTQSKEVIQYELF